MPMKLNENSSNSELVLELIEVLKKEASLFETFLELLEEQQKALVENNVEALNRITERHREKIIECSILAKKREAITNRLSSEIDPLEDLTISRLIEASPIGEASMLERLRGTILDFHEKISKLQSQNKMLIERSRDNIAKTMELLGRFKQRSDNYHEKGGKNEVATSLALDRRV
jgi:hypothetical protein